MGEINHPAIAIVGVGALLPDAPTATTFWENIRSGRYSICDVPEDRWDPELFFDADPKAPAKTYSKIGGWVQEWEWDPIAWRLPIPPKVSDAMDRAQKWAVAGTRQALADYGYPQRPLNPERTAVILGNAMAGEQHYLTAIRILLPEYELELARSESFSKLDPDLQMAIRKEYGERIAAHFPEITEDSMPGELGNIIAGRVANLFDFRGPNFVTDAACASAMAAIGAAIDGLEEHDFDAVVTGGVDSNMSASTFTKFCKIGALSATGTRPYSEGADGFVMGEGAALFVLKRLEDAVRDEDPIYALIRGVGGSSDGRGKGITAPNPIGQKLAVERAWLRAGLIPDAATLIEGHGTSTRVGDVAEVNSLTAAFEPFHLDNGSIPLGSVKSNIGHLKGAAGAAGILKAVLALRDRLLPPSLGYERPNPRIDFRNRPFYVNSELKDWVIRDGDIRRVGVSAFGFGGTNFHVVLEEYRPGSIPNGRRPLQVQIGSASSGPVSMGKAPLRGALLLGADSEVELVQRLQGVMQEASAGRLPNLDSLGEGYLGARFRLGIDFGDGEELMKKATKAIANLESGRSEAWRPLRARGVFFHEGPASKVAMLFTGQGSQYLNMLRELRKVEPVVAETFDEADAVMMPLLDRPLTEYLFSDTKDPEEKARFDHALRQTAITQPAVLTVDIALQRLLAAYGIMPDFVMGHSLGEYGALVACGALAFRHALEAVSARGMEMMKLSVDDNGSMAAVFAPLEEIERILGKVDGYVVVANINSPSEAVIGGATEAVARAVAALNKAGYDAKALPVSHAFHTAIVAPVSGPLRGVLETMNLEPPSLPIVSNVTGEFYPMGPGVEPEMIDLLSRQVSQPVQFVKGLETLYRAGARVFVEVGPKRALQGMVRGLFENRKDVLALSTNHPRLGDVVSFNQALCGLWASGVGAPPEVPMSAPSLMSIEPAPDIERSADPGAPEVSQGTNRISAEAIADDNTYLHLGRMFADVLERGMALYSGRAPAEPETPVVITGASLGLPGTERVFDDHNAELLLTGQQFIRPIPEEIRQGMVDKNITRLVKSEQGGPHFESIEDSAKVIKLAARAGKLDLVEQFGYPADRLAALDVVTELAIGAGIDALRDAGIPLVRRYKTTSKGTKLPDSWGLPTQIRDDTGVIFASAFPGVDFFASESKRYYRDRSQRLLLGELEELRARLAQRGEKETVGELDLRIGALRASTESDAYTFDRRFLFKLLSMGHSQFAEFIGARGPNTQINAACASGTQAVSLAEDWIRAGRCKRVVVISADNVTSDPMLEWMGAGFLAAGAAATDENVEDAAIPFDRRRHGMIVGMGAAGMVVESSESARERGLQPICEVLNTVIANSAFHGTRLDVEHISKVMESLIAKAEARWGIDRRQLAPKTVFISHETYTPARGGSAQAEIFALRRVFGEAADQIVIANTKGYTGHPMAVAIEEVLAVRSLETGIVPPVANIKEIDPELGDLNLSVGGRYPVEFALRLGAGFGSQISMSLLRLVPSRQGRRPGLNELGYEFRVDDRPKWESWLHEISGYPAPTVEVTQRTLRIRDEGPTVGERPSPEPAIPTPSPRDTEAIPAVSDIDPVGRRILEMVAEMTGYPEDMLDLDLDMEADLGIDTVKQAEMFAAIREEWGIPRDENLQLRDFPTLALTIRFVYDRRPDLAVASGVESIVLTEDQAEPALGAVEGDPVARRILEMVAEMTGYPEDMLDLDLDMEADLGIDTVKQAEMFAAIRTEWNIPRDEDLQLRNFPTLAHTIQFVYERKPDLLVPADDSESQAIEVVPEKEEPEYEAAVPRRVPVAVPRPELDLCKPTAVASLSGRRVVVMPDEGGVGMALARRLDRMGAEVLLVEGVPDDRMLADQARRWLEDGGVDGVYWLPALDAVDDLAGLTTREWEQSLGRCLKAMHSTMQALWETFNQEARFLVAATRMGGRHGYDSTGASAPMGGAVCGFSKAFKRERPLATVKVVDFERDLAADTAADALIDETLRDPGVVEVGYRKGQRWTVGLTVEDLEKRGPSRMGELGSEPVFLVTGAAGSIVSAIVGDLAQRWPGHFYLLDLTPEPATDDLDLELFREDKEALKRRLFERLKKSGEKATPAAVDRQLAALERSQAALAAVQAVEEAGGRAHYRSVDLLDFEAVAAVIAEIGKERGRIDVLLHAAGMEVSHMLPDKSRREFDRVFDVKATGWFHLLRAAADLPIAATVVFTSIAGRFGNAGQTDYSAANDLLCKLTSNLRSTRPETRGIAIDWSAWAEIGMASRGSIPTMMVHAGIDMVAPEVGVPIVGHEIAHSEGQEIVIAGALGSLLEELDETAGIDASALEARFDGPMIARMIDFELFGGLTAEVDLDPREQPFLFDHTIEGTAVLPGVMGIEAFAELATAVFPGWSVSALENLEFLAPFKFYRDEPRTLRIQAEFRASDDDIVAVCRLIGRRLLAKGERLEETVHFIGEVRLSRHPRKPESLEVDPRPEVSIIADEAIYAVYFHGPAYRVLGGVWPLAEGCLGRFSDALPGHHVPADSSTVTAPRLVEMCFQTAGLIEIGKTGRVGLPRRLDRLRLYPSLAETADVRALVKEDGQGGFAARVIDLSGNLLLEMTGYATIESPMEIDRGALKRLSDALAGR